MNFIATPKEELKNKIQDGSFYDISRDIQEMDVIMTKGLKGAAGEAYERLHSAYKKLRKQGIPNDATNRMHGVEGSDTKGNLITLKSQLANAASKAAARGKSFNPEQTIKYFNAKDLNKDGVLDEKEQKTKLAKGWNQ